MTLKTSSRAPNQKPLQHFQGPLKSSQLLLKPSRSCSCTGALSTRVHSIQFVVIVYMLLRRGSESFELRVRKCTCDCKCLSCMRLDIENISSVILIRQRKQCAVPSGNLSLGLREHTRLKRDLSDQTLYFQKTETSQTLKQRGNQLWRAKSFFPFPPTWRDPPGSEHLRGLNEGSTTSNMEMNTAVFL